jgi:hypothetical protein
LLLCSLRVLHDFATRPDCQYVVFLAVRQDGVIAKIFSEREAAD